MVNNILKHKLKVYAATSGYNGLYEVARELEIDKSFLSLIINGKKHCGTKTANKIIEKTKNMGEYAVNIEDIYGKG